jgi:hypothetical protein
MISAAINAWDDRRKESIITIVIITFHKNIITTELLLL